MQFAVTVAEHDGITSVPLTPAGGVIVSVYPSRQAEIMVAPQKGYPETGVHVAMICVFAPSGGVCACAGIAIAMATASTASTPNILFISSLLFALISITT